MIPSLQELQRLCPIGPVELDSQARRDIALLLAARQLFVALRKREYEEDVFQAVGDIARERVSNSHEEVAEAVVRANVIGEFMASRDSTSPAVDFASVENNCKLLRTYLELMKDTPMRQILDLFVDNNQLGLLLRSIHAGFLSTLDCLIGFAVFQSLYRQHSEIRFPLHMFIRFTIAIQDETRSFSVRISGYHDDLISMPCEDRVFKIPDTAEEFLRGCTGGIPTNPDSITPEGPQ